MRKLRLTEVKLLAQLTRPVSQESSQLPALEPHHQGADILEAEMKNEGYGNSVTKGTLPHS